MSHTGPEILHGVNPAFETLRARRRHVHRLWIAAQSVQRPRMRKLAELAATAGAVVEPADKQQLFERAGTRQHQGVVFETDPYPYIGLDALWAHPRLLLLDNVEDPQNTGAILRSAEGLGFGGVVLPAKGVPEVYASVVKASAGASEHLEIHRATKTSQFLRAALERGYHLAALDAKGTTPLPDWRPDPDTPLLLVVGGEDKGVGRFILIQAQATLAIPSGGRVRSYNASVSAALAMYQATKPAGDPPRDGGRIS